MKNLLLIALIICLSTYSFAQSAKPSAAKQKATIPTRKPATTTPPARPPSTPPPSQGNGPIQAAPDDRKNSANLAPGAKLEQPGQQPIAQRPPSVIVKKQPGSQYLKVGDVILNGGFGFPEGTTLVDINGEYLVSKDFGLGGGLQFTTSAGSKTILGLKGNYHLARAFEINNSKLDPWLGVTLSRTMVNGASLYLGGQLGLRYMYQRKFGVGAVYNLYFGDYSGRNHFGIYFSYKISK